MLMFLVVFVTMLIFVAAMAVGVIMGRKPLKGSCGGVGKALGEPNYSCDICGGDPNKCDSETEQKADSTDLGYDVSKDK